MSTSDLASAEYEMQLYGFTRSSVVDAVKGLLLDTLEQVLESISGKLVQLYQPELVGEFISALTAEYRSSIESHSAQLETIVAESFNIDPAIYLPEDEIQAGHFDEDDEAQLDKEVEAAQQKLEALGVMQNKLRLLTGKIFSHSDTTAQLTALTSRSAQLKGNYEALSAAIEEDLPTSLIGALVSSLTIN